MNDTTIDLGNTVFEGFPKIGMLDMPTVNFWHKGKTVLFKDFGTIVIIAEDVTVTPELEELILGCSGEARFVAPEGWRMPNVMKALGAFQSTTAARKNGWNLDIPEGHSQHVFKLHKIRGVVTIHKVTAENPFFFS